MADVFISYSRKDSAFVRRLFAALEGEGRDAWVDWEGIPLTADWLAEIYAGIEAADTFIFVISPDSVASEICAKEVAHAVAHKKRLVPILHREIGKATLPERIGAHNWLFFREGDDFDAGFKALMGALDTDLEWAKAHTRLLTRSVEWERRGHEGSLLLRGRDLRAAEEVLADASDEKSPQPTPLQRQYVLASRKAASGRTRAFGIGAGVVALVLAGLAVFAFLQRNAANDQRTVAERERDEAELARQRTEEQRQIAIARQLVAQGETMRDRRPELLQRAALLAVESNRRSPSAQAEQVLRSALPLLPQPVARMAHDEPVKAVAYSPDGRTIATASDDGSARLWEAASGRELARLGHGGKVNAVAFSPDGRLVATAGADGTARTWEVATGRESGRYAHAAAVQTIAFSPDGRYIVSGGDDPTSAIWEAAGGKLYRQLPLGEPVRRWQYSPDGRYLAGATARGAGVVVLEASSGEAVITLKPEQAGAAAQINALAFRADGTRLVTAGADKLARVWSLPDGRQLAAVPHDEAVTAVAISPDGGRAASGSADYSVRVWELATGKEIARGLHDVAVFQVAFSPDGRAVASASHDRTARLWDAATGRELLRMTHDDGVNALAFSPDGRFLATAPGQRTVLDQAAGDTAARLWELTVSREGARTADLGSAQTLRFSPDSRAYVAVDADGSVKLWRSDGGGLAQRLPHERPPAHAVFSPDGATLATAADDGTIRLWRVADGQVAATVKLDRGVNALAFSPDGRLLATAEGSATGQGAAQARLWEVASGREVAAFAHEAAVGVLAFSPDGRRLATASGRLAAGSAAQGQPLDVSAQIWDVEGRTSTFRTALPDLVNALAFSADGRYLAAGAGAATAAPDRAAYVWEVAGGRQVVRAEHADRVIGVAFRPDGRSLVTASWDGTARVWAVDGGGELVRVRHDAALNAMALSADGRYFATASQDRTARLWETESGREVLAVRHDAWARAVILSPDGRYMVSAGNDKIAQIRLLDADALIAEACARLSRNLTESEWRQYLGEEPYRPTCANLPNQ